MNQTEHQVKIFLIWKSSFSDHYRVFPIGGRFELCFSSSRGTVLEAVREVRGINSGAQNKEFPPVCTEKLVHETLPHSPPHTEVLPPGLFEQRYVLVSSLMWKTYVSDYFPKFGMNQEWVTHCKRALCWAATQLRPFRSGTPRKGSGTLAPFAPSLHTASLLSSAKGPAHARPPDLLAPRWPKLPSPFAATFTLQISFH